MKDLPLLSICIAAYNVEQYIEECLNSIRDIEKKYTNKEIIIVNDCSKDNTKGVIQEWINNNKDIKVIYSDNVVNKGPSGTYNTASDMANGKYITFLDGDDFLIKESFFKKVEMFSKNPELKMVYGNCYTYSREKGFIHNFQGDLKNRLTKSIDKLKEDVNANDPQRSISTSIIDLNFWRKIGGFDPDIRIDRVINLKIIENIESEEELGVYNIPCFAYRMHNGSVTKNVDNMLKEKKLVIDKYVEGEFKNIAYSNTYYEASLGFLRQNKYKKAFHSLKKSLFINFSLKRIMIFFIYMVFPLRLIDIIPNSIKKKILGIIRL